ncbi:MAG: hypothetical protein H0U95_03695 [Bacteroidetes bacterium]|nr:hypothetical protein [Bacteroidota bacterium]
MKNSIILISSILMLGLVSCKTKSKTTSTSSSTSTSTTTTTTSNADGTVTTTSDRTVYNGVTDKSCAVEVSFGSPGSGIDGASFDKVNALIESKKLKSSSKSIGREGEKRICLPLTELKENEKKEFIDQLKKIAKEGQYVSLSIR